MPPSDLLTVPEVAEILRVPVRTAYALVRTMRHIKIGRLVRVPRAALDEWLRERETEPLTAETVLRLGRPFPARRVRPRIESELPRLTRPTQPRKHRAPPASETPQIRIAQPLKRRQPTKKGGGNEPE